MELWQIAARIQRDNSWDIRYMKSFDTFDVSSQTTNPIDLAFNSDGTKLFVLDETTDVIYQYGLSTAYDFTTLSYDSKSVDVTTNSPGANGIYVRNDTDFYVVSGNNNSVDKYTMTANDVSTASYASQTSGNLVTELNPASNVFFKDDGTKMYVLENTSGGDVNNAVFQYTLSTPWDVSTDSYDSVMIDVEATISDTLGIYFSSDGDRLFLSGNSEVEVFDLSTAWDLSTTSLNEDMNTATTNIAGLTFNTNGESFYYVDTSANQVIQYSLSA